jgi:protein-S-isoprenylcysteine O-methyltransferase Ste14
MQASNPAQGSILDNLREIAINVILGALFAIFAYAAFLSWRNSGHVQMLLLAAQECIIVGLVILRRRTREVSTSWWDRLVAVLGTAAPLLQRAAPTDILALEWAGTSVQILGTALSLFATISLGRSFGIVAANRGVRTTGFYHFVRHPLYGSYAIGYLGFLLGNPSILNGILIATAFACQYLRAVAEERILARDPAYQAYMQKVRYRFIPYIF